MTSPSFEKGLAHLLAIDVRSVGTFLSRIFETVAFSNDFRVFARDRGKVGRKAHMTGGMTTNGNGVISEFLDVAFVRSKPVHDLNYDGGWGLHAGRTLSEFGAWNLREILFWTCQL